MFYKEWKSVQVKCWLWLIVYGFFAAMYALFNSPFGLLDPYTRAKPFYINYQYLTPLYQNWLDLFFYLTVINAILGGVDSIAEEKSKQTLGFLLSRPVPRSRIYTAKLLTNIGGLWATGILASLLVWLVDVAGPKPFDTKLALFTTLAVLLFGTIVVCLTALVSIYTHSAIQTLAISLVILGFLLVIPLNVWRWQWNYPTDNLTLETLNLYLTASTFLAFVLYYVGLVCFQRKEF